MVRHCVFVRFKPEISRERIDELFAAIDSLRHHLPGVLAVCMGTNTSPEVGMDKGYSDGFIIDFEDTRSRDIYLADEQHKSAGSALVAAAENGIDGILVFDMEIG